MKRTLLLISLIFGLALSGCSSNPSTDPNGGQSDPNQTETETGADVDAVCSSEKKCKEGLACVLGEGQTSEGTCVKTCSNGGCDDDTKVCKSGVAVVGGETADVCQTKSEEETQEKAGLGEKCDAVDGCKENLACVKHITIEHPEGIGRCETACDDQDQCENSMVCETRVRIDDENVKVCEEEQIQDQPLMGFGEECTETQKCQGGLVCVANEGVTNKGTCQHKCNETGGCDESKEQCHKNVPGLGTSTVDACLEPVVLKEGEECRKGDTCEDGTLCLAKVARDDLGICTKARDCSNPSTTKCPSGNQCYDNERVIQNTGLQLLQVCLPKWCESKDDCDTEQYCAASPTNMLRGHCKTSECDVFGQTGCPAGKVCISDPLALGFGSTGMCIDEDRKTGVLLAQTGCETNPCQDPRQICVNDRCTYECDAPGYRTQCHLGQGKSFYEWCIPAQGSNPGYCGSGAEVPAEWKNAGVGEPCGQRQMCDIASGIWCFLDQPWGNNGSTGTCRQFDKDTVCYGDANCTPPQTCKVKYQAETVFGGIDPNDPYAYFFDREVKTCQD